MDTEKQELRDALAGLDPIVAASKKNIETQIEVIRTKAAALHKAIDVAVDGALTKLATDMATVKG